MHQPPGPTLDGELGGHGGLPGPVHHQAGVHAHVVLAHLLDLQDLHPILLRHRHSGTGLQGSISLWWERVAWSENLLTCWLCPPTSSQSLWDRPWAWAAEPSVWALSTRLENRL